MKILIDMNLSRGWVTFLREKGHDVEHWSKMGKQDAPDGDIVSAARVGGYVVLTCDLDFGNILAMSGNTNPSVIQLRSLSTLPRFTGELVSAAITVAEADLDAGAILTLEPGRTRLRSLVN